MHRAWLIDDVWRLLASELPPPSLAALAQTCKALFPLATDELWRNLTSFTPFLSCLPKNYLLYSRTLTTSDSQRLDLYASKVWSFVLESTDIDRPIRLGPQFQSRARFGNWKQLKEAKEKGKAASSKSWEELWEEIATLRPQEQFLPHLRRLRISGVMSDYLLPLVGISGESLEYVYIKYLHGKQSDEFTVRFLEQLQDAPRLEYLFVRDGQDLVPAKLLERAPLKHLRLDPRIHAHRHQDPQFKKTPIKVEILVKDTLEHLTLGMTRDWYTPEIAHAAEAKVFLPNLKTLWLNLTTFKPGKCAANCENISAYSWTCDGPGVYKATSTDCGRRSPTLFLDALGQPELELLNMKFPIAVTGPMMQEVVEATKRNCRLEKLEDLAVAGGGWFSNCIECGERPAPKISPLEFRQCFQVLLPLPRLKVLRLSAAPNFLDVLDLDLYKEITDGLPLLEKLYLGHVSFASGTIFFGTKYYERVPLHHIAAFCHTLPHLAELEVGNLDGTVREENPRKQWACPSVKKFKVSRWVGGGIVVGGVGQDKLHVGIRTYFPFSDLAEKDFGESKWIFTS